jgi:hypothetical protein
MIADLILADLTDPTILLTTIAGPISKVFAFIY